jgi:hypothetical protein
MTTQAVTIPDGPFDPTWESLERYQVPQWYVDAKFGCKQKLKWTREPQGLRVKVPAKLPCEHAWTLKVVTK